MDIPRFAAARHRLGLTASELGRALGINPRQIRYYEAGERTPSEGALAGLADLLAEHERQALGQDPPDPARPRGWHVALAARQL